MKNPENGRRKPYFKPEVHRIPLTPEETLAANCKTAGGGGPGDVSDCLTDGCYDIGS